MFELNDDKRLLCLTCGRESVKVMCDKCSEDIDSEGIEVGEVTDEEL